MHGYVIRTQWLTPTMVRVVLGGGQLRRLTRADATDAYVNLAFAPHGESWGVFDPAAVTRSRPRHEWPARRRYTVRHWDEPAGEMTIDFVVHGDDGVAGRWAGSAAPGDVLVLEGAAGGYRPDPAADWHLFVGDESAVPAVAASLAALPDGVPAVVRLVCDGPGHEVELATKAAVDVRWLHRAAVDLPGELLLEALQGLVFLRGSVHAFVHGEAEEIRGVRRNLLLERAVPRGAMSCSPYWRRTMTDEAWRQVKADFLAAMQADVA